MSSLNFVRRPASPQGWRLALAAAGGLMLAAAAANWVAELQSTHRLQARLDAQAPLPPVTRPALPPAQQQALDQQLAVVTEAVRQLNLPVTRLLRTVQAPDDIHVALLGLDLNGQPQQNEGAAASHDRPAGALSISAEAQTAPDMLRYLAFLNQQPLFRSVYLIRHEASNSGAYRFQLEATWRE